MNGWFPFATFARLVVVLSLQKYELSQAKHLWAETWMVGMSPWGPKPPKYPPSLPCTLLYLKFHHTWPKPIPEISPQNGCGVPFISPRRKSAFFAESFLFRGWFFHLDLQVFDHVHLSTVAMAWQVIYAMTVHGVSRKFTMGFGQQTPKLSKSTLKYIGQNIMHNTTPCTTLSKQ